MKKLSAGLLAFVFGMAANSVVLADDKAAYLGLSYYSMNHKLGDDLSNLASVLDGDEEYNSNDLMLRLGGHVTPWLATELRVGRTVPKEELDGAEFYHRYIGGVYLKLGMEAGPLYPYLLGGYTRGKGVIKMDDGDNIEGMFREFSYGAGLDFDITDSIGVNIEYVHIYDADAYDAGVDNVRLSGVGAGLYWRF